MAILKPQPGFQEQFLQTPADIAIGGGAAFAGKTFALLLGPVRNKNNKDFGAVIFRKSMPQIRNEGGLWDTSTNIYPYLDGAPRESILQWNFPSGAKIKFSYLDDNSIYDHQGAQYPYIGFDELCHFSESSFWYLQSRNRSTCGTPARIRATCNPDPDSFVAKLIEWYIDENGFPINDRAGVLRYFMRSNGNMIWGNTKKEVFDQADHIIKEVQLNNPNAKASDLIKSFTFIPGKISDNKIGNLLDPGYIGNLMNQDEATRMQLLEGNWKIRTDGSGLFDWNKIEDIFTNFVTNKKGKYITCDAARFGRDLCVTMVWFGHEVIEIHVLKKSDAHDIVNQIEQIRMHYAIGKSEVLIDQDGVGGGSVKLGGYRGFSGGHQVISVGGIVENYLNLKTQCYYRTGERVNNGEIKINITNENCFVDNVRSSRVKMGSKIYSIKELICEDLRAIKKDKIDHDGKKRINAKEDQKVILGRSPDFADCLMMREYFEIKSRLLWV